MTIYAGKNRDNAKSGFYKNFTQKEQKDTELINCIHYKETIIENIFKSLAHTFF